MSGRFSRFGAFLGAMLFFVVVLGQISPQPAEASHFRGSLVTVEYHAPTGSQTSGEVHITSTTLTRKGAPDVLGSLTVYSETGGVRTALNCNGTFSPATSTTDSTNPLFEISTDVYTVDGCFTSTGAYVFQASSCCRIAGILNTPNTSIQFQSRIIISNLAQDTAAPTYNAGYMYNIAYQSSLNYSTNLGGLGQGNTAVTYALVTATGSALDGYGATRVPCSDLNTQTGEYRINSQFCQNGESIATAFGGGAKYYALKVNATDSAGQYSTRDVLLYFNTTTNQAPVFTSVPPSSAFTVAAPSSTVVTFCAQDPDPSDVVGFTYSPTRSWITKGTVTILNPPTTPNTYCVDFTLAPPAGTAEAFNFEVSAYDNNANFVQSASNLYSFQVGGVQLPGNTPTGPVFSYNPSSYTVPLGTAVNVAAPTSTGTAVVTFSINPALPNGVTFNASNGAIAGATHFLGTGTYTVTGVDAGNLSGTTTLTINFVFVPPTFPEITSITPRLIELGNTANVTVTGNRLGGLTNLLVRGIKVQLLSNTDGGFVFVMPAQTEVGIARMSFNTPNGSLNFENALEFYEKKLVDKPNGSQKVFTIFGFAPGSSVVTLSINSQLKKVQKELVGAISVSCVGFTQGPIKTVQDLPLASARANQVCSYLKKVAGGSAEFSQSAQTDSRFGADIRRVVVTVTK